MEGVEEREGRGQRVRSKSSGFPGAGKQSSRGCAGQSAGRGKAGLQAPRRPRWWAGDHRLQLQEGRAHEGRRRRMKEQTQLHPNNPQHPSGQTHSLIQPGPPEPAQPQPASWRDRERAGGQLPQSKGASSHSLVSAGHLRM